MLSRILKIFIVILILVAVAGGFYYWYEHRNLQQPSLGETAITYTQQSGQSNSNTETNNSSSAPITIPGSLLIKVPFTPQAPTANWDELHNEACEEAVSVMVNAYFNNIADLPPEYVESEISKLTEWQDQNQGYHLDQTIGETAKMIESEYGLKTELNDFDENAIKQALVENKLVIASFYGRDLRNPNYKQPGPIHHMMVINGWNKDGTFMTNDPGTKRGKNFQYQFKTLYNAAGDWDHNISNVDKSKKFIIIVSK